MTTKQCSSCGDTKPITTFYKRATSKDGYSGRCILCEKRSVKRYYNNNSDKIKKKLREDRIEIKKILVEYKGGECQICGYNKCLSALDFHHEDTSEKCFSITKGIISIYNISRLRKECDKCILLCANCHREFHYGDDIHDN